jgi:hypothetical protein
LVPAAVAGEPKTPTVLPDGSQPRAQIRLQIVPLMLQPGEELIVGRRLREILSSARKNSKV